MSPTANSTLPRVASGKIAKRILKELLPDIPAKLPTGALNEDRLARLTRAGAATGRGAKAGVTNVRKSSRWASTSGSMWPRPISSSVR